MDIKTKINHKTVFTRMCITEAILALLKTTPYEKLRISAVAQKAGVARMTFYNYYESIYDALTDYLQLVVAEYVESSNSIQDRATYLSYEHILYSLQFFDKYADYFLTLAENNLHTILLTAVNTFLAEQVETVEKLSIYELYAYAGGLLNTFLKWEQDGKKDSAAEVAAKIYNLYGFQRHSSAREQKAEALAAASGSGLR